MDALTFIIELAEVLIWPLVVVIAIFIFRRPLEKLIPFLRRLKIKEFEVEFQKGLADIKAAKPQPPNKVTEPKLVTDIKGLAQVYPRAAISESWRQVETSLKKGLGEPKEERGLTLSMMLEELSARENVLPENIKALNSLRQLRNKAVHADDFIVTTDQALAYVDSAGLICQSLEGYFQKPPDAQ